MYVRYLNLINNHIRNDIGKIEFSTFSNKSLQEYCDKGKNNTYSWEQRKLNEIVSYTS